MLHQRKSFRAQRVHSLAPRGPMPARFLALVPGAPREPRMGESGRGPAAPRSSARNGGLHFFPLPGHPAQDAGTSADGIPRGRQKSVRPAVLRCAPALRLDASGAVRSPRAGRSPSWSRWARPDEKQESEMAAIGSFKKSENGDYAGAVKTLTLNVKARITPVEKTNDTPTSAFSPAAVRSSSVRRGGRPRTRAASISRSSSTTRASRRRSTHRWSRSRAKTASR